MAELSDKAKSAHNATETDLLDAKTSDGKGLLKLLVEKLVEIVTGRKVKIATPDLDLKADNVSLPSPEQESASNAQAPQREGWGVVYNAQESHYEREDMSFEASGVIKTRDGQEISFKLQFTMTREYMEQSSINFRAGDAVKVDPLVINFDGNAALLTDEKFSFDLDADGNQDDISFVKSGSGFLALDLNTDGVINDGRELFGPQSGNGFTELAKYDEDGNQWIDEEDSVFNSLRIWTKDAEGNDVLSSLASKNIGAIYLGQASSPFGIRSGSNASLGEVKSTGVYLKEDGGAGSVQQIDLAA